MRTTDSSRTHLDTPLVWRDFSQLTLQFEPGESMMELTMLNPIWIADLAPAATPPWLWDGFIAPGSITLFSSQAKTGKPTLLSPLLARRRGGGPAGGRGASSCRSWPGWKK